MRRGLLGLVLLLVLAAGCGQRHDDDENLAIFKYNESAGILTLDPIYAKDLPHIWACNQVFNSLVAFDDKMNLVPMVAKSWDVSEDGLRYTFHLRDDVQFHDDTCFYQSALRPFEGPQGPQAQGPQAYYKEMAFSGLHFFRSDLFAGFEEKPQSVIDLYLKLAKDNRILSKTIQPDYWFDLGKPEQLLAAENYIKKL